MSTVAGDATTKLDTGDWLRGLLMGAIGAFGGFLAGLLIAAIFGLQASPPSFASGMPYVASIGGFAFGFVAGAGRDII